jgi:hypothetical protein
MADIDKNSSAEDLQMPKMPCLAKVIHHIDSTYMGSLKVQLLGVSGDDRSESQTATVNYISPFLGSTGSDYTSTTNDYNGTQKSYGFWGVPPDPGTIVAVIFINGDAGKGYWFGCVPDLAMNFMIPGLAATESNIEGGTKDAQGRPARVPVAEYNKSATTGPIDQNDSTNTLKPTHPFTQVLTTQGLILDDTRGITTSSARREIPSAVVGLSSPGPLDKTGPSGQVGTLEGFNNIPISRLGGSTFVMDDGSDKFLRKTAANAGPPAYAAVQSNETGGNPKIPHNELVRIRTRTGHQILLHNSEDLIYIGNAKGTTWIELTSNGKIDIFAEDSISIHSKTDMNFYANRDINMEAGRNVNIKATNRTQVESGKDTNIIVGANGYITTTGNLNVKTTGNQIETAAKIYLNSNPAAVAAKKLTTFNNSGIVSIMKRIPTAEPWAQHENLDPLAMTAAKTDREAGAAIAPSAAYYKTYTTATDVFKKVYIPSSPPNKGTGNA